ncbi:OVARIAN TUMOR DOMAIN-containing deubiquitinating enzyme 7 isoform X2 [Tripterygium wilfordii]|uniref:OVARIAN TUMOR DOMAIN-containing deubiquitinating enzyme 7 isoform X2 n=1 Tax=Tripterygium wilfordii TaxID=458696 RepID=UPI0018F813C3|nr:OVARIAN TUMOR DOMAIN-containing deubiquitinating enzyme 7 isoform X2 [Tripterygium wilfordii]
MAKAKQQNKSKPKKQTQIKKRGKQGDVTQFRAQLDALGLQIVQVTADGNCFFRSIADQLEGNEQEHGKYRSMIIQYIMKNREMFEPFIEDDVLFDEYCQSMEKDGTWAGNMELQAASLVTHCNICIHRNMSPRWYIRNFDDRGARMVHLSYHDGEHYNSVRLKEDPCDGPARSMIIKADADLSMNSHKKSAAVSKCNGKGVKDMADPGSTKLVMSGSSCESVEEVKQILLQVGGDVDAAIEILVAEQGTTEFSAENDSRPCIAVMCDDDDENGNLKQQKEETEKADMQDPPDDSIKTNHDDDKLKIPRNKACPCGSKKKYKACCGSVKGRSSVKIVNNQVDTRKGRKKREQFSKQSMPLPQSDGGPPDMGALCI